MSYEKIFDTPLALISIALIKCIQFSVKFGNALFLKGIKFYVMLPVGGHNDD